MKSIKQWLMENDDSIRTVDLQRILGSTTVHVRPDLYSKLKTRLDQVLDAMKDEFARDGLSKVDVFRQVIAIAADQISDDKDSRTVSVSSAAKGLSGGYGADEPIARESN